MNRQKKTAVFISAVAFVGAVSAAVTFYQFTVGSGCLLLAWSGLPCPTCGMTRATLCFLSGRITEAFGYHPLFWAPYPMVAMGLGCIPRSRFRRWLILSVAALGVAFIAVWLIRVTVFGWRG